jgi:hypothetical protein
VSEPLDALLVGVLDEILGELKAINAKLAINAQQARVEVKTSTRGVDVAALAYETTAPEALDQAGDNAAREYLRVVKHLEAENMKAFVTEANRVRPA